MTKPELKMLTVDGVDLAVYRWTEPPYGYQIHLTVNGVHIRARLDWEQVARLAAVLEPEQAEALEVSELRGARVEGNGFEVTWDSAPDVRTLVAVLGTLRAPVDDGANGREVRALRENWLATRKELDERTIQRDNAELAEQQACRERDNLAEQLEKLAGARVAAERDLATVRGQLQAAREHIAKRDAMVTEMRVDHAQVRAERDRLQAKLIAARAGLVAARNYLDPDEETFAAVDRALDVSNPDA